MSDDSASLYAHPAMPPRFWRKVTVADSGCWLWNAAVWPDGYAAYHQDGRTHKAHRAAYERLIGAVTDGLVLDHLCRVRNCVNPNHLEPVTQQVNTLRGEGLAARYSGAAHCKRGHAFDEANTGYQPRGRYCITCRKQWKRTT